MKLAIVGLLLVGQAFAAPQQERHRRDAPILPEWQLPVRGFDEGEVIVPFDIRGGDYAEGRSFGYSGDASHDEYGVPAVPFEDYGPPEVPHEEYGPLPEIRVEPVVTEHYCPEEDIVPPFAPAPPPPEALPLPVPFLREEVKPEIPFIDYGPPAVPFEDYGPPAVPFEDYGPPEVPHEEYGPLPTPFVPAPPPPPFIENPYPVRVIPIVTEAPTTVYYAPYPAPTTQPPPPPPPPFVPAPYPAKIIPEPVTTTTEVPTTVRYAPYPAKIIPFEPVTTTTTEAPTTVYYAPYPAPTTPEPVRSAPYPARQESKYENSAGASGASEGGSGGFSETPGFLREPAVRAPDSSGRHIKSFHLVKPQLVFTRKVVSFPKFAIAKKFFKLG